MLSFVSTMKSHLIMYMQILQIQKKNLSSNPHLVPSILDLKCLTNISKTTEEVLKVPILHTGTSMEQRDGV